jgi:hypothetical protein
LVFVLLQATALLSLPVVNPMAATIIDFDPHIHQKVRHNDQLYVVFLKEHDFFRLPPDARVVVHLISGNKIVYHDDEAIRQLYTVKKRELIIVAPHAEE